MSAFSKQMSPNRLLTYEMYNIIFTQINSVFTKRKTKSFHSSYKSVNAFSYYSRQKEIHKCSLSRRAREVLIQSALKCILHDCLHTYKHRRVQACAQKTYSGSPQSGVICGRWGTITNLKRFIFLKMRKHVKSI